MTVCFVLNVKFYFLRYKSTANLTSLAKVSEKALLAENRLEVAFIKRTWQHVRLYRWHLCVWIPVIEKFYRLLNIKMWKRRNQ